MSKAELKALAQKVDAAANELLVELEEKEDNLTRNPDLWVMRAEEKIERANALLACGGALSRLKGVTSQFVTALPTARAMAGVR